MTKLILFILALVFNLSISWLITVGVVYLVCLCLDLTFTWLIATGIWLAIMFFKLVFS